MIWEIAKKEVVTNIGTPKIIITYCVCTVLILASIIMGAVNYTSLREEKVLQTSVEKDRLRTIEDYRSDFLDRGVNVYRQPNILTVFSSGIEGDAAQRSNVNGYANPDYDVSRFNSHPVLAVFGLLDFEFIVKIVLSLFAILFTFDAISGEKTNGTLKLALSNSVKRSSILLGKYIGNVLVLLIPFFVPMIVGMLLLVSFFPGVSFNGEDWIRIGLIMLTFVLFLMTYVSLGIMVSSLTSRPFTSFLVLLMLWVVFIGVTPRVSVMLAETVQPVPSTSEIQKEYLAELGPIDKKIGDRISELWDEYNAELRLRRPAKPVNMTKQAEEEYNRKIKELQEWARQARENISTGSAEAYQEFTSILQKKGEEIARKYRLVFDRRNNIAMTLSRFSSPVGSLTLAVNRLAKTGIYSSDRIFRENVDEFQTAYNRENFKKVKENPDLAGFRGDQREEIMDMSSIYPDINAFHDEPLNVSLAAVSLDFAVLLSLSIVFVAVAFVAFSRYDVR